MSMEDSKNQVNGINNSDKMDVDISPTKLLQFDPLPQRVPRLNRRGFYLSGRDKQAVSSSENNSQNAPVSNACVNSKSDSEEKIATPLSNRIIKLSISKKSLNNNENEKCLKRTVNGSDQHTNSDEIVQQPPPKKHKPITWP